jgi:short-subunit dehydrogenase
MHNQWSGRWVLITGASAGIGKAFAEELAAGKANLVLTARRTQELESLATRLSNAHGIRVATFAADLNDPAAPAEIFAFTRYKNISIDFLINNAGFGKYGEFAKSEVKRQTSMVRVNCEAVVHLTHLFLNPMVERRKGDILILASTASYQAVPYLSVYAATKAFDLLFAEALAQEVKQYGIRVCALCPGSTESEFHAVAGAPIRGGAVSRETAQKVVGVGLDALLAGKHSVISGVRNRIGAELQRLVPRRTVTNAAEKLFRPKA